MVVVASARGKVSDLRLSPPSRAIHQTLSRHPVPSTRPFQDIPCHPPDPFQDIPCHPDPFQDQHTAISKVTLWTLFVQLPRLSSILVVRAAVFYPRTSNCCCYVYVIPPSKSARFALDLDIPSFSNAGPEKWAGDDKLTTPPS